MLRAEEEREENGREQIRGCEREVEHSEAQTS
jgi:hypothetical protein